MFRFWIWLRQLWSARPDIELSREFIIPATASDDEVMAAVLRRCLQGDGESVFATRQDDGSVLVQAEVGEDDADADASNVSRLDKSDWRLLPPRLTAENGAKALLVGEFHEKLEIANPDFCGCGQAGCVACDGDVAETIWVKVPVSWPTIKEIYSKASKYFSQL